MLKILRPQENVMPDGILARLKSPFPTVLSDIRVIMPHLVGGGPGVVVSTAAFHARVRGSIPGLGGLKETKMFLPHPRVKVSIVGSLRDREVACSALDCQGSNFESCVWRTVSSHHPQEVLLAQFSLYVHKGGLKPDSFHFISFASLGKPKNGEKNPVSCHFFLQHLKKMIVTICIWKNEKIRPF